MNESSSEVVFTIDPVELEDIGTIVQCVDEMTGVGSENITIFVGKRI